MLDRIEAALTPARRRYVYRITLAALGILGVYGLVTADAVAAWALLAAAVTAMADRNVPTNTGQEEL